MPVVDYAVYDTGTNWGHHGGYVAPVASARNNGVAVVGVAPLARLALFAVVQNNLAGPAVSDSIHPDRVTEAIIDQASEASVISMSFKAVTTYSGEPYGWGPVGNAIDWAFGVHNTVFVASTGNAARSDLYTWPAQYQNVIGVGGLDQNNLPVAANYAPGNIAIAAPATRIQTLCIGGGGPAIVSVGGSTSLATPMVAAAAHMVRTVQTSWTAEQVKQRILGTATRLLAPSIRVGAGLLNVYNAVHFAQDPPEFSVSIAGTNPIRPFDECTWVASVTAGTGPFSYQWYRDGVFVGSNESYTGSMDGDLNFELEAWVTDNTMSMVTDMVVIWSDAGANPCLE